MASRLTHLGSGGNRRPSATGPSTTGISPTLPRSRPRRQARLPSRATIRRRERRQRARDRFLQGRTAAPHRQRGPPSRARNLRGAPLRREMTARTPAARKGQQAVRLTLITVTASTPSAGTGTEGLRAGGSSRSPTPGTARISGPSADGPVSAPARTPASERPWTQPSPTRRRHPPAIHRNRHAPPVGQLLAGSRVPAGSCHSFRLSLLLGHGCTPRLLLVAGQLAHRTPRPSCRGPARTQDTRKLWCMGHVCRLLCPLPLPPLTHCPPFS